MLLVLSAAFDIVVHATLLLRLSVTYVRIADLSESCVVIILLLHDSMCGQHKQKKDLESEIC